MGWEVMTDLRSISDLEETSSSVEHWGAWLVSWEAREGQAPTRRTRGGGKGR